MKLNLFICLISCAVQTHFNGPPCNEDHFMVKLLSLPKVKLKCMEQLNEHQTEISWTQSNSNRFVFCDSLKFDNRTQSNSYLMVNSITTLIVPITIFSILICSLHACLSHNRHAITWVSNYRYPVSTSFNNLWIPVTGCLHHSYVNYVPFNGFLDISYSCGKHDSLFCSKEVLKRLFWSKILLLVQLISNWTSCQFRE